MTLRIGVVGLGSMGGGVALALRKHDFTLFGCETRRERWAEFEAVGISMVAEAGALPDGLDVLVLFVLNAAQAKDVLGQALERLLPDGVVIGCVTVSPRDAVAMAASVTGTGRLYLDAPVSGGSVAARAGRMTMMASGPEAAFDRALPVLEAIADKVWRLGDAAGVGSTIKMIDTPHSAVEVFVKDLGIVLEEGHSLRFPLPLAAAAHQLFLAAAAGGHGASDDAFVIRVWERLAGIHLPGPP